MICGGAESLVRWLAVGKLAHAQKTEGGDAQLEEREKEPGNRRKRPQINWPQGSFDLWLSGGGTMKAAMQRRKKCAGRSGSGLAAWWPERSKEQRKGQSTRREGEAKGVRAWRGEAELVVEWSEEEEEEEGGGRRREDWRDVVDRVTCLGWW
ncbi:hypothetical protein IWX48DRAFT_626280 [Phyllosticta citricarpa]